MRELQAVPSPVHNEERVRDGHAADDASEAEDEECSVCGQLAYLCECERHDCLFHPFAEDDSPVPRRRRRYVDSDGDEYE